MGFPRIFGGALAHAQFCRVDLDIKEGLVATAKVTGIVDIEELYARLGFFGCSIPPLDISDVGMPVEDRNDVGFFDSPVISSYIAWIPFHSKVFLIGSITAFAVASHIDVMG